MRTELRQGDRVEVKVTGQTGTIQGVTYSVRIDGTELDRFASTEDLIRRVSIDAPEVAEERKELALRASEAIERANTIIALQEDRSGVRSLLPLLSDVWTLLGEIAPEVDVTLVRKIATVADRIAALLEGLAE